MKSIQKKLNQSLQSDVGAIAPPRLSLVVIRKKDMDCPRCIEKMEETTSKGIITHTCFYCNGTWINSDSLKIILENENNRLLKTDLKKSFESLKVTNKDRLLS